MSEVSGGSDWWQGEDDKWYPPIKKAPMAMPDSESPVKGERVSSKKQAIIGLIAVVVIALGLLVFKQLNKTEYVDVKGSFTLTDNYMINGWSTDENCNTGGGYSDINSSTSVVAKNAKGEELARTSLGIFPTTSKGQGRVCEWSFILSIPKGEKYYVVSIGDRGEIQKTMEELIQSGIHVGIDENK